VEAEMNFVILVPLAWLPLLIIVMVFVEVLGDYLFTMVAWFVLAVVIDVILYNLLMPVSPASTVEFAICLLLIPMLAPFVGCYVRSKREQRQEDLKRAKRTEEAAERAREQSAQDLEREVRRMAEQAALRAQFMAQFDVVGPMPDLEACKKDPEAMPRYMAALEAYEAEHGPFITGLCELSGLGITPLHR
jgi:K+-sensing histidine kinase KdpD